MNAGELFREGKLVEATEMARQEVKSQPTDTSKRIRLSQLLLFCGDWERADKQMEVVSMQAPESAVGVALLRQLIRGEVMRQQFFAEGRSPHFLCADDTAIQLRLQAFLAARDGQTAEAMGLLEQAEQVTGRLTGCCDGQPFTGLRDLDDLLGTVLETITPNGKYFWVNMHSVRSLQFYPPEQMHDLIWRRATAAIQDGPEGDVYIPVLYPGSHAHVDDLVRLGRKTDWTDTAPVRGVGQRELLIGDDVRPLLELEQLSVSADA